MLGSVSWLHYVQRQQRGVVRMSFGKVKPRSRRVQGLGFRVSGSGRVQGNPREKVGLRAPCAKPLPQLFGRLSKRTQLSLGLHQGIRNPVILRGV